jgi:phosphoribosylformylglycinamidine synthase PurS subunit
LIEPRGETVKEYAVEVRISPREGLLDPQGKAIYSALHSLEFDGVESVRVGRLLRLKLLADSPEAARDAADDMCRKLLANPVTEDYDIAIGAAA